MRLHCSGNKVILRSEENSSYGEDFVKDLLHGTEQFLAERTLKPKL